MIDTLNISELSDEVKKLKANVKSIVSVPTPETTDAGKLVGVNEDGEYELIEAPSGGGGSYNLLAEYEDQYGESATVGAIFEAFIAEVDDSSAPPDTTNFINYKFTIGGNECRIISFVGSSEVGVSQIILAYDECNKTSGSYDGTYNTTTFYYTNNAGTKTSAVKQVNYKTSGITVSDINSYAMMFMGKKFRCYKLG